MAQTVAQAMDQTMAQTMTQNNDRIYIYIHILYDKNFSKYAKYEKNVKNL